MPTNCRSVRDSILAMCFILASFGGAVTAAQAVDVELLVRLSLLTEQCQEGDAAKCIELGALYESSRPFPTAARNARSARLAYEVGCGFGSAVGCNDAAIYYWNGSGGGLNYATAQSLFERACRADLAIACSNLALMYRKGHARSGDPFAGQALMASVYDSMACDLGDPGACNSYAIYKVEGTESDQRQAAWYFRQACDGGLEEGCANLRQICSWWVFPPSGCSWF